MVRRGRNAESPRSCHSEPVNTANGSTPNAGSFGINGDGKRRPGIEGNGHSRERLVGAITLTDIASRRSLAPERMRRHGRRREAGQQCITLTLHEYQVWGLVACGFLVNGQWQNREAVADALRAYLSDAMPPIE